MEDGVLRYKSGFTGINNDLIRDPNLSVKSKGLYTVIQSYVMIPNSYFTKRKLMELSGLGEKAFESAWKELKDAGYIKTHVYRRATKLESIIDVLYESEKGPHTYYYNSNGELSSVRGGNDTVTDSLRRVSPILGIHEKTDEKRVPPVLGIHEKGQDCVPPILGIHDEKRVSPVSTATQTGGTIIKINTKNDFDGLMDERARATQPPGQKKELVESNPPRTASQPIMSSVYEIHKAARTGLRNDLARYQARQTVAELIDPFKDLFPDLISPIDGQPLYGQIAYDVIIQVFEDMFCVNEYGLHVDKDKTITADNLNRLLIAEIGYFHKGALNQLALSAIDKLNTYIAGGKVVSPEKYAMKMIYQMLMANAAKGEAEISSLPFGKFKETPNADVLEG